MNMHAISSLIKSMFTKKPKNRQIEYLTNQFNAKINQANDLIASYNASNEAKKDNSADNLPPLIVQNNAIGRYKREKESIKK